MFEANEEKSKEPKKDLTNIQYQRLLMTYRVLAARGHTASVRIHDLVKSIHAAKKDLGLDFSEEFTPNLPSDKNAAEHLQKGEATAVLTLNRIVKTTIQVLLSRLGEINNDFKTHPDKKPEKTDLEKNIDLLSEALQFNELQNTLLHYFACSGKGRYDAIMNGAMLDEISSKEDVADALSIMLDVREQKEQIKKELDPEGVLLGANFLKYNKDFGSYGLDAPLIRILSRKFNSKDELLATLIGEIPTTELKEEDYAYMKHDLDAMTETVEGFINDENPKTRKNIAIGGPPGTGKTQVTVVIARRLNIPVFLVGVAEKSQTTGFSLSEPSRDDRINALVRASFIVRRTKMRAWLIFDEAEDVLRDLNREGSKDVGSKAFINELLENLGVAVGFISNRTDLFDPATTRRLLPYFGMNYMPLSARVNTIITKAEKYLGLKLEENDVKDLSRFARKLSVAIIDSCVKTVGIRSTVRKFNKQEALAEITNEFNRALKAQNGGIPPLPIEKDFDVRGFIPELISATDEVEVLRKYFEANPEKMAGKDFTIIGDSGTGRSSIAQYIATATGMSPRVMPLNPGSDPDNMHALDLERAELDRTPLVFTGALEFIARSKGHPFLKRVQAHSMPTFFVCDYPNQAATSEIESAMSHLTFLIRTQPLAQEQFQSACKQILEVDISEHEAANFQNVTIGQINVVKSQLEALGQLGNKELTLERIEKIQSRLEEKKGQLGFAEKLAEKRGSHLESISRRAG